MGDSTTQEREDLEQLVATAGWRRFLAHAEREWGTRDDGGGIRFMHATSQAAAINADADAMAQLRQIIVARREIHTLIAWVEDTLKATKKAELQPVVAEFARRGRL